MAPLPLACCGVPLAPAVRCRSMKRRPDRSGVRRGVRALRYVLATLAVVVLVSCTSTPDLRDALARGYARRPVENIVRVIGYPTQVHPYGKNSQLYVWEYSGTVSVPRTQTTTHQGSAFNTYTLDSYTYSGTSTSWTTTDIPYGCRIVAEVNADGLVIGGTVEGSNCNRYRNLVTAAPERPAPREPSRRQSAESPPPAEPQLPTMKKRPEGPFSWERIDQDHATYAPTSERDHAACGTKHIHGKKAESTWVEHGPHCPL